MIYRSNEGKKGRRKGCLPRKKTMYIFSGAQFVAYTSGLSGVFSPFSLPLFASSHLPPESPVLPQFSPHFCADRTVSRHRGSIVLWHMEGPWTRPCFPRAVPRGFSRDVSPNWPSGYFTLLPLVRIRPHAPARNIFIRISSPFTFPLLRCAIGYDRGFARILTRDLYALRSYWDGLSDKIPVYFFSIMTNKAGIPRV